MRSLSYVVALCSLGFTSVSHARPEYPPGAGQHSRSSEHQRPYEPKGPHTPEKHHHGHREPLKPHPGAVGVLRVVNDFPYSVSIFAGMKLLAKLPPRGHRDLRLKPGHRPLSYRVGGAQVRFELGVHVHPHRQETLYLSERHPSYQPPRPPPVRHHASPPKHHGHGHRH